MPIKFPDTILRNWEILVVDDVVPARRFATTTLQQIGFKNIKEAMGVEDSLKILRQGFSGMVLSDLHLKDGKATDLIQKARELSSQKHTPFMVITSDLDPESAAKLEALGIATHILKPYSADLLAEKVALLIVQQKAAAK